MTENAAPNKSAPRSQTEAAPSRPEPADPKQRKPRAEHYAELLMGLANQSKQSSVDAAEPVGLRRMLNQEQVLQIIPVSAVTLWRMIKAGRFPKSTFISPNRCIWYADEIAAWQTEIGGNSRRGANHLRRSKSKTT